MPADPPKSNQISPESGAASVRAGDVPEAIRRRYYEDRRGGVLGFYEDAQIKAPAFQDRGRALTVARASPQAVRDMTAIAQHRGWTTVVAQGSKTFRREAWLAGGAAGIEVRGYRPTDRDLQALERRLEQQHRREGRAGGQERKTEDARDRQKAHAIARLDLLRRAVASRVEDVGLQERILGRARERLARWLERGGEVRPSTPRDRPNEDVRRRVRQR